MRCFWNLAIAFSSAVRLSSSSPKRLSTKALALRSCRYSTNNVFFLCNIHDNAFSWHLGGALLLRCFAIGVCYECVLPQQLLPIRNGACGASAPTLSTPSCTDCPCFRSPLGFLPRMSNFLRLYNLSKRFGLLSCAVFWPSVRFLEPFAFGFCFAIATDDRTRLSAQSSRQTEVAGIRAFRLHALL